nr:MAG TPA: hypothetical protein [Caudoviricetes sp.]
MPLRRQRVSAISICRGLVAVMRSAFCFYNGLSFPL